MKPTIVSLRARWAKGPPPIGSWIVTAKGGVFRVLEHREGGVTCARHSTAPQGVKLRPWSELIARESPPQPNTRMRRTDHLQHLLHRGAITQQQYDAAVWFRTQLEGSMPSLPVSDAGRVVRVLHAGRAVSPNDSHLRARKAVQRALAAVGREHLSVLNWCVAENGSLQGYAAHVSGREAPTGAARQKAALELRGALERLELHCSPPVVGRR